MTEEREPIHSIPSETMIQVEVDTFVGLCTANAELGVALVDAIQGRDTPTDEPVERKVVGELRLSVESWKQRFERVQHLHSQCNDKLMSVQLELQRAQQRENNMQERHALVMKDLHKWKESCNTTSADVEQVISAQAERIRDGISRDSELKERLEVTNDALKEKAGFCESLKNRVQSLKDQMAELRMDAGSLEASKNTRIAELTEANAALLDQVKALRSAERSTMLDAVLFDKLQLLRDKMSLKIGGGESVNIALNLLDAFVADLANPDAKVGKRKLYWIYSLEHHAWWRGRTGYTRTTAEAATWSEEEAVRICRDANFSLGGKPCVTDGKDLMEVMVPVMPD